MRIVDRETFLAMPAGTIYAKYGPSGGQPTDGSLHLTHGEICIKGETVGADFVEQELFPWFEGCSDTEAWIGVHEAMLRGASSPPLDYDFGGRDGLFDEKQLFAVWEKEDARRLIVRLHKAISDAFPQPVDPRGLKLVGKRYGAPHEQEVATLEEAIGQAYWAVEDNHFGPERVVDRDGNVILDVEALSAARDGYDRRIHEVAPTAETPQVTWTKDK